MEIINPFNTPIYKFESIDSTNKYGKELCKDNVENGTIILAESQTNGRGRLGNSWDSQKGKGLYYSIILHVKSSPNPHLITLFMSLALTDLLKDYSINAKIKWPNDILIDGKKVCGILSELIIKPHGRFIIVGIGVNLYQNLSDFREELKHKATSITLNTGSTIIKNFFINSLNTYIYEYYNHFLRGDFKEFLLKYKDRSSLLNKEICVRVHDNMINGIVKGFSDNGNILIETKDRVLSLNGGEVTLRDTYKRSI